jgi:hypothetical protein
MSSSPKFPATQKTPSLLALAALVRGPGGRVRRFALVVFPVVLIFLLGVLPAFADSPPSPSPPSCSSETHTSIFLESEIGTGGLATHWGFSSSRTQGGPWTPVPGGEGTLSSSGPVRAELTGLTSEVPYFFLLTATNSAGTVTAEATKAGSELCETVPLRPEINGLPHVSHITATSADVSEAVTPNELETQWRFESATSESGPWTPVPGGEGTITQAEAEADLHLQNPSPTVRVALSGLSSGTTYYVRLFAESEPEPGVHKQATSTAARFETSGPPLVTAFATHAIHGEGLRLLGYVTPNNSDLNEIQTVTIGGSPTGGSFTLTSGGQSVVATSVGDLTAGSQTVTIHASNVEGLEGTLVGTLIAGPGIPADTTITAAVQREKEGHLEDLLDLTLSHAATASGSAVALSFGLTELPADATHQEVGLALSRLSGFRQAANVTGPAGGPYTVEFINALASTPVPLLTADGSALTPSGTVTVATAQQGVNYATHYHFEYVTQGQFEEAGFAGAQSAPELPFDGVVGAAVGEDVPQLQAGVTYHYRLAATNTTPGDPVVHSAEQTLTVPAAPAAGASPGACANQAFRVGASAALSDCRAYEQVTPADKEGAEEAFHYHEFSIGNTGALVGEDGDHVGFVGPSVHWGLAGGSPYLFSRTGGGWQLAAGSPQPEAGINAPYTPELYSPDLTQLAFMSGWQTGEVRSPKLEFRAGPFAGPYATAASVSRAQMGEATTSGWLAGSEDLSHLIFGSEDRALIAGHPTGSASGMDLYEYVGGVFAQANVDSAGHTVGSCGASVAAGTAEPGNTSGSAPTASRHSVSADGSRLFFYAHPTGSSCSEARHLYLRIAGAGTIDIGAYKFLGANRTGSQALLGAHTGESKEVLLYDVSSHASTHLFSMAFEEGNAEGGPGQPIVSEDFSTIYVKTPQQLTPEAPPIAGKNIREENFYRYDVPARTLSFIAGLSSVVGVGAPRLSADGRYVFLEGSIAGVPGGVSADFTDQVYRYDSAEHVVECVSCASPFDPEPRHSAVLTNREGGDNTQVRNAVPHEVAASGDGNYVFFDTVAALVPQDVNGEVKPEEGVTTENPSRDYSSSSDVYEWRRSGVTGCVHVQGCVTLISSGQHGRLVVLLGTAAEGRDVFFTTADQLLGQDNDGSLDIYDARIGGGFPAPAPRPVECEASACSTPASPPSDATPASLSFSGAGNLLPGLSPPPQVKPKPKAKPGCKRNVKRKSKRKCHAKPRRHAAKRTRNTRPKGGR